MLLTGCILSDASSQTNDNGSQMFGFRTIFCLGFDWFFQNLLSWPNGILLPKPLWPTVRKNCFSDREKVLKLKTKGPEFAIHSKS